MANYPSPMKRMPLSRGQKPIMPTMRKQLARMPLPGERVTPEQNFWTFLIRWFIASVTTLVVFYIGNGISVASPYTAFVVALTIGLVNAFMPQVVGIVSFNVTVLSLGLFTLIGNCFLLTIAEKMHVGVAVASFDALLYSGLIIATVSWFSTMAFDSELIIN